MTKIIAAYVSLITFLLVTVAFYFVTPLFSNGQNFFKPKSAPEGAQWVASFGVQKDHSAKTSTNDWQSSPLPISAPMEEEHGDCNVDIDSPLEKSECLSKFKLPFPELSTARFFKLAQPSLDSISPLREIRPPESLT